MSAIVIILPVSRVAHPGEDAAPEGDAQELCVVLDALVSGVPPRSRPVLVVDNEKLDFMKAFEEG